MFVFWSDLSSIKVGFRPPTDLYGRLWRLDTVIKQWIYAWDFLRPQWWSVGLYAFFGNHVLTERWRLLGLPSRPRGRSATAVSGRERGSPSAGLIASHASRT